MSGLHGCAVPAEFAPATAGRAERLVLFASTHFRAPDPTGLATAQRCLDEVRALRAAGRSPAAAAALATAGHQCRRSAIDAPSCILSALRALRTAPPPLQPFRCAAPAALLLLRYSCCATPAAVLPAVQIAHNCTHPRRHPLSRNPSLGAPSLGTISRHHLSAPSLSHTLSRAPSLAQKSTPTLSVGASSFVSSSQAFQLAPAWGHAHYVQGGLFVLSGSADAAVPHLRRALDLEVRLTS